MLNMEDDKTEYISGDGNDFIQYIFSSPPKEPNSIKLQLDPPNKGIKLPLHIFQELLMIFIMGMKYVYSGSTNTLSIEKITKENIQELNNYFQSFGFTVKVEKFTIYDYLSNMKLPNYFLSKELIKEDTLLRDMYYERLVNNLIYRITFDFLH